VELRKYYSICQKSTSAGTNTTTKKEHNIRPGGNEARKPDVTESRIQNNTPTTATNNKEAIFPQPFDVCCKIDTSFQQCVMDKANINEEDLDALTLGESWDPNKITLRLMNGEYDILVEDMLNEPIEIYEMQKIKTLVARGKSGKAVDIDDNVSA
jgi:hypothetical protein